MIHELHVGTMNRGGGRCSVSAEGQGKVAWSGRLGRSLALQGMKWVMVRWMRWMRGGFQKKVEKPQ